MNLLTEEELEGKIWDDTVGRIVRRISSGNQKECCIYRYIFESDTYRHALFPLAAFSASEALKVEKCLGYIRATKIWISSSDQFMKTIIVKHIFSIAPEVFSDGKFFIGERRRERELATIIHLAMIDGWDMELYCDSAVWQIEFSHDGIITYFVPNEEDDFSARFERSTGRHLERKQ